MPSAEDYEYIPAGSWKGPQGIDGIPGDRGVPGPPGIGIRGERGPAGLMSVEGATTDEAIRILLENPETQANGAVVALVGETIGGFSLSKIPYEETIFAGESVSKPRPLTDNGLPWPGPVYWSSTQGQPTYMLGRDKWFDLTAADTGGGGGTTPGLSSPLTLDGIQFYNDPTNTGVADAASMSSYPDRSSNGRTFTPWTVSSSGATNLPVYAATGMNGKPAVNLIPRSGWTTTYSVAAPSCVVLAANAAFTGALPTTQRQLLNSMGNGGKYSIARTPTGKYAASVDAVTWYEFGDSNNNSAHDHILVADGTTLQVWLDGSRVLNQAHGLSALPSISQHRWGYAATTGDNTAWQYSGGLLLGDAWVNTPATTPANSAIASYSTFLKSKRAA